MDSCREADAEVLDWLAQMSGHALEARHEEDFLRAAARSLQRCVGADAVILRLLERHIHTRAVATAEDVAVLPPDELWEPFTAEDERFWLDKTDGVFCDDVASSPFIKPSFRHHALQLGLRCGFMVPALHRGEICGQVVFAWRSVPDLDPDRNGLLRRLANFTCLQFTLFNARQATDLDPMTGLLNWRGLERRWELVGTRTRGAVLLVDLENFRSLVDRHGRLAGHDLVRDAARLVRGMIGSQAVMGRLGSDTFVALVPNTSPDDTVQLRLEMGRRFDEFARSLPDPRPYLTVGAALWPQGGTDLRSLVAAAERNALERKRQQAKLTMSTKGHPGQGRMPRTFLSGWLTTSCDGVLITDPDLKVFYVNPAYERMTGYTMKEWLGKGPGFIASSKTPRTVYEEMWDSLNDSGAWTGKVVNRHRSGREWVSHLSITRVLDRSGRVTGYVGVARDVTEAAVDEETAPSEPGAAAEEAFTNEALAYSLAEAAQMHSGDTGEHLDRVKEFTRLLTVAAAGRGIRAFQSYRFRSAVTLAYILHDVGKLAIPQGLLLKPGRLSVQEFELVKTHTLAGRQLLQSPFLRGGPSKAPSLFLEAASAIAGGHHEKWDGSGYPEGLAGRDIPMEARVVAIADVYDALRSRRPYKEPWSHDEAVAYIESQAGKHFDPDLVEVFASVSDEFDDVFGRMPDGYGMGTA